MTVLIVFDEVLNISANFFEPKLLILVDHLKNRVFPLINISLEHAPITIDKVLPIFTSGGIPAFAEIPIEIQCESEKAFFVRQDDLLIGLVEISQNNLMQSRVRVGTLDDFILDPTAKIILDLLIQGIKRLAAPAFMEQKQASQEKSGHPEKPKPSIDKKEVNQERPIRFEKAIIAWVTRDILEHERGGVENWLTKWRNNENPDEYISVDQFKEALRKAGDAGLIKKVNGRWKIA